MALFAIAVPVTCLNNLPSTPSSAAFVPSAPSPSSGQPGGSGGGGGGEVANSGGSGNTPPVSPAQGTNGGNGGPNTNRRGGGGGGATAAGQNGPGATNLVTGILIKSTIFDLLCFCGLSNDERLIKFLNLQLKLYSQEDVYNTAALYGSTVLQMCQKPHGLWHLKKSMQALSDALEDSLKNFEKLIDLTDGFNGNKILNKISRVSSARILLSLERHDEAIEMIEEFSSSNTNGYIHELTGDILVKQEKNDLAKAQYEMAVKKYSDETSKSIISMKIANMSK